MALNTFHKVTSVRILELVYRQARTDAYESSDRCRTVHSLSTAELKHLQREYLQRKQELTR
jgi:hypothetical protein